MRSIIKAITLVELVLIFGFVVQQSAADTPVSSFISTRANATNVFSACARNIQPYTANGCSGDGWIFANAATSYCDSQHPPHNGSGCVAQIGGSGGALVETTKLYSITPGMEYTLSFYMQVDQLPQGLPQVYGQFWDTNQNRLPNQSFERQSVTTTGQWQEVVFLFKAPAGSAFVMPTISMDSQTKHPTGNSTFSISDAFFGAGLVINENATDKTAFNGSQVQIQSSGNIRLWQNSQWTPFFPICIYANNHRTDWSVYKTHGFNCNMWGWDSSEVRKAQQAGLYSGYQIARFISPSNGSYNQLSTLASDIDVINADSILRNSLLFYYWDNENDELPEWNVPAQVTETINAHDLNSSYVRMHPLYSLQGNVGIARKYNSAGAVSGTTDSYGNILSMSDSVGTYVAQDSTTSDGVTNYTRTFGQAILNNIEQQRQPVSIAIFNGDPAGGKYAGHQFKAATYTAISNGAKGIAYWKDCDIQCDVAGVQPLEQTAWWTDLPSLAAAIQSQLPVIQTPLSTSWHLTKTSTNDNVQAGTRTYQGKGYVIAGNENNNNANPTFSISGMNYSPTSVINAFTKDSVASISGNNFTLPINANDGGFYVLGDNAPDSLALNLQFNGNLNDSSTASNSNGALVGGSNANITNNTLVLSGGYAQVPSQLSGSVPASPSLEMNNNLTIVARINISTSQTGYAGIVAKGATADNIAGYAFFYDAASNRLNFWYGAGHDTVNDRNYVYAQVPSLVGAWHTLAVSASLSGSVTFYVDGTAYTGGGTVHAEAPSTVVNPAQPVQIGAWGAGNYLQGAIDNARIYKAALTTSEIASLSQNILQLGIQSSTSNPRYDLSLFGNDIASTSYTWNSNNTSNAMIGYQPLTTGSPIYVSGGGGTQNNLELDSSTDWSLAARVQMSNVNNSGYAGIIAKGATGTQTAGYALVYNTAYQKLGFFVCCSGTGSDQRGYFYSPQVIINDGNVHDVAVTFSRSNAAVNFYVDGSLIGQTTVPSGFNSGSFINTGANFQVGSWAVGNYLNGEISNIFVDRRVITSTEIQQRKNIPLIPPF